MPTPTTGNPANPGPAAPSDAPQIHDARQTDWLASDLEAFAANARAKQLAYEASRRAWLHQVPVMDNTGRTIRPAGLLTLVSLLGSCAAPATPIGTASATVTAPVGALTVATVTADAVAGGQLFCSTAAGLVQAGTVKVPNADSRLIAASCAVVTLAGALAPGTPTPATVGATALVGDVVPALVAAVDAYRGM